MISKRIFDLFVSALFIIILSVPMLLICLLVLFSTKSTPIYWSKRIGKNNDIFLMPKFRSMRADTPQVATHLLQNSASYITNVGQFLRKTSLDELPQLFSILIGDMSFVGPRPALFNQYDLIDMRTKNLVHKITPGLTGWAQINGRDELSIEEKVKLDTEYLEKQSFFLDIKIIFLTFFKVAKFKGISH